MTGITRALALAAALLAAAPSAALAAAQKVLRVPFIIAETNFDPALESANYIATAGGGPAGLALDETNNRLYVLTRFDNAVSVLDPGTRQEVAHVALHNPEPASVVAGRPFLYDARATSSNGEASCASCHVFADLDSLAWDLGNPDGAVVNNPNPIHLGDPQPFHPLKGPMTTQTLRGLGGIAPLHWRGDRVDLAAFNRAFPGVMGGATLATADLNLFTEFMRSAAFPPNPNQNRDRTFSAAAADGKNFFETFSVIQGFPFPVTCSTCHSLPTGTGNMVITAQILQAPARDDHEHRAREQEKDRQQRFASGFHREKKALGYTPRL